MSWHDAAAQFVGGMFLANFVPHFVSGVTGQKFHSPFAKPPFRGLSSPVVNILWGLFNLGLAWVFLFVVGRFEPGHVANAAVAGGGFGLAAVGIARSLGRIQRGR